MALERMSQVLNIADPQMKTVSLSNRQFAALKMFTDHPKSAVELENALEVNQKSFGSLFQREYIAYDRSRNGFVLTPKGQQAMRIYNSTDIMNKEPAHRFSHYIRTIKSLSNNFHFEAIA